MTVNFSLILPCYNEELNIIHLYEEFKNIPDNNVKELIFVNNGSTDNTEEKIDKIIHQSNIEKKSNLIIKKLNLPKNQGYGGGIKAGLEVAQGDFIGWTHADLQTPLIDFFKLYNLIKHKKKILGKGMWDGVVDTVGGNILANAISQTKHSGIVAICGNASGNKLNTSVIPFILRGVKLWGVDSIMVSKKRKEFIWSEVSKLINFQVLEKSVKTVSLSELLTIFPNILEGKLSNKILVDVNK